ncbi:MAG: hypothetical protein WDN23_12400 [Edaphobacter sp.]
MKMIGAFFSAGVLATTLYAQQAPTLDAASRQLSHDIFKQLIEINTTDSVGSTTVAAEAMRKRLVDAGFAAADVVFWGRMSARAIWWRDIAGGRVARRSRY